MLGSRWLMITPPPPRIEKRGQAWTSFRTLGHLTNWAGSSVVSIVVLLSLGGCNPVDDRLWPSIQPPDANRPAPSDSGPFFRALPGSIWEWTGVFSLLLGAGGVGFLYWRFPGLREEFSSLRDQTRRLHERRDRSTVDLAQMARNLRDLEQEITVLRGELSRRDTQAPPPPPSYSPPPVPAYSPPSIPSYSQPPAPSFSSPPAPTVSSAPATTGSIPELPYFSPPSPPERARPHATPSPSPLPYSATPAAEAPLPIEREPAPSPVSLLSDRPDPEPAPSVGDSEPDAWRPQPGPSLDTLIKAINSRGQSPIEGVTCVELDIAPPPEEEAGGYESLATRLRMVARGGRFLLVMVDGDAWLFPTVETLDGFLGAAMDPTIFESLPDTVDTPRLISPAMLREVGGLWEVTDPGKVLVPAC